MKTEARSYVQALMVPILLSILAPDSGAQEAEWKPIFNGTDLSGFVNVNCAPSTWTVREGMIVCSGKPTGVIRTDRMYENFILELEYRHMKSGGNAGLFIWSDPFCHPGQPFTRSIEVQVMDGIETDSYTSHGDIFSIWGAKMTPDRPHPKGWERCLPSEKRAKPSPEWNHYRVIANMGTLKLEVNGKEVSGAKDISPRKGYLCLESEGSECHFRNLRIKELPSAKDLAPPFIAEEARGFRPLYTGIDLAGWKVTPKHEGHWIAKDCVLDYDGQGDTLWTEEEFGDFELMVDWRWTGPAKKELVPVVLPSGETPKGDDGAPKRVEAEVAGDSGIYLRGSDKSQVNIWCWPIGSGEVYGYRTDDTMSPEVRAAVTPKERADAPIGKWNRFLITMRGDRLSVVLNGKLVIDQATLPGVPARGPIALQHHGAPIQFMNLAIRPLKP